MRPVRAEVDLAAIRHNVSVLRRHAAPASMCVVVKADGYGHGAVEVARAALDAGAERLAVALASEGAELRAAGVEAPVLVLSEAVGDDVDALVEAELTPVVYSADGVASLAAAVARSGRGVPVGVHLKVNTGMNRVGVDPDGALDLADAISASPELRLEGLMTHLAVADEPEHPFTGEQLARFAVVEQQLAAAGHQAELVHLANSAGALVHPATRRDLVRCGIAVYGIPPAPELAGVAALRPALRLRAEVSHLRVVDAGARVSYGLRYEVTAPAVLATVPIGYADGVPRRLPALGGEVLVGGRRVPMAGVVTMDQLVVDLGSPDGPARSVSLGDEVVLLGEQGTERITPDDWARALDTIAYEIVCGVGPRVPRTYVDGG